MPINADEIILVDDLFRCGDELSCRIVLKKDGSIVCKNKTGKENETADFVLIQESRDLNAPPIPIPCFIEFLHGDKPSLNLYQLTEDNELRVSLWQVTLEPNKVPNLEKFSQFFSPKAALSESPKIAQTPKLRKKSILYTAGHSIAPSAETPKFTGVGALIKKFIGESPRDLQEKNEQFDKIAELLIKAKSLRDLKHIYEKDESKRLELAGLNAEQDEYTSLRIRLESKTCALQTLKDKQDKDSEVKKAALTIDIKDLENQLKQSKTYEDIIILQNKMDGLTKTIKGTEDELQRRFKALNVKGAAWSPYALPDFSPLKSPTDSEKAEVLSVGSNAAAQQLDENRSQTPPMAASISEASDKELSDQPPSPAIVLEQQAEGHSQKPPAVTLSPAAGDKALSSQPPSPANVLEQQAEEHRQTPPMVTPIPEASSKELSTQPPSPDLVSEPAEDRSPTPPVATPRPAASDKELSSQPPSTANVLEQQAEDHSQTPPVATLSPAASDKELSSQPTPANVLEQQAEDRRHTPPEMTPIPPIDHREPSDPVVLEKAKNTSDSSSSAPSSKDLIKMVADAVGHYNYWMNDTQKGAVREKMDASTSLRVKAERGTFFGNFTKLRHRKRGLIQADKLLTDVMAVKGKNAEQEICDLIHQFLMAPKTNYNRHSCASFLVDELLENKYKYLDVEKNSLLKPKEKDLFDKRKVCLTLDEKIKAEANKAPRLSTKPGF